MHHNVPKSEPSELFKISLVSAFNICTGAIAGEWCREWRVGRRRGWSLGVLSDSFGVFSASVESVESDMSAASENVRKVL